jgi:acetyl-CoA carboxylase carboxyl transferase beta subunit/acetyl-CoA carboxylase carboxyl transferase alpha subunit
MNCCEGEIATMTDWVMCPACGELLYRKRLVRNLLVCRECGSHHRLTAAERVAQLFDADWVTVEHEVSSTDVLGFVDSKPYPRRLHAARRQTGLDEGVLLVRGTIDGNPLIAAVMDFQFLGGSLGGAVGELITRAAELALDSRTPLLIVSASGGARMQEGVISLMQMAKTSQAIGQLDEAGILTISLVTDPTYGGVAASYATLCDVIVAEPGARLGFAGPRVIEQTIRQVLPAGFQTAESLLAHGLIDVVKPRGELRQTLARLLRLAGPNAGPDAGPSAGSGAGSPEMEQDVVERDHLRLPEADVWQTVQRARDLGRPTALDLLRTAFEEFEELHGDRLGGDCPAIVAGLARLGGRPVMAIGHQKGPTISERAARNYGMATPSGYRKAARLMSTAAKLRLPVVTLVDTPGAYPGIEAEEQGQAVAIAENIRLMAALPVPVVCVITGEGGSGGALALAVADEVLICSNGTYSVISPEGCASILWHDSREAPAAAAALRLGARDLLALRVVDGVIKEPDGGSQADPPQAAARIRTAVSAALDRISRKDAAAAGGPGQSSAALVAARRARFRSFGTTETTVEGRTDAPAYAGRA